MGITVCFVPSDPRLSGRGALSPTLENIASTSRSSRNRHFLIDIQCLIRITFNAVDSTILTNDCVSTIILIPNDVSRSCLFRITVYGLQRYCIRCLNYIALLIFFNDFPYRIGDVNHEGFTGFDFDRCTIMHQLPMEECLSFRRCCGSTCYCNALVCIQKIVFRSICSFACIVYYRDTVSAFQHRTPPSIQIDSLGDPRTRLISATCFCPVGHIFRFIDYHVIKIITM